MNTKGGIEVCEGGSKFAKYGPVILMLVLLVAALGGIVHYVHRAHAIQNEVDAAHSQCVDLFGKAAKTIGVRHDVKLTIGAVSVERFIDRADGPDTLDCRTRVKFGPNTDEWIASGNPGKPFLLQSARLAGSEMVDEYVQQN